MGCEFMKKNMNNIIYLAEYKNKKRKMEINRVELLELIKQVMMTKQRALSSLFYFKNITLRHSKAADIIFKI